MVWSPDFASKVLKLKKRSDFYVGPFFMPSISIFMNIFYYVTIQLILVFNEGGMYETLYYTI